MTKIAVLDLLFRWPPDGGARVDVKEVLDRLHQKADVCLFVPDYSRYFRRGMIREPLDFPIVKVPFNTFSFNAITLRKRFADAIGTFAPDILLFADGWYLKPDLFCAFKNYHPWLRFYAYENICLRSHGTLMRDGTICPYSLLDEGPKTFRRCTLCNVREMFHKKQLHFIQEYLFSGAFLPSFPKRVTEMLKNAGGIIVYNEFLASKLRPFNENVHIIPSGTDSSQFRPDFTEKGPGEKTTIGLIGRVTDPHKGFGFLVSACRHLHAADVDFSLQVTVDADEIDVSAQEPFLRKIPWMTPEVLKNYYRELDICVIPSLWPEPFGIVAIEAMAAGKPVIVTKVGGLQDIVRDGETGFIVEPGDEKTLAEKLRILIENPSLRSTMGKKARKCVEEHYDWDRIMEKHYYPLWHL